jgi:uncharacterized protein (TIGR02217 family)
MSYLDAPFPERIAFGAERVPEWSTLLAENATGYSVANQNWSNALHSYDVSLTVRVASDYKAVLAHFHTVRGRAYSFPFKDFLDFQASDTEGVTTFVSTNVYQLQKKYSGSSNPYERKITRPVSGTCVFYRTRAAVRSVITPVVDYATGRMTVSGHQEGDVYTWAGEFRVPVRYLADRLPAVAVNKQSGNAGELYVECQAILLGEVRE